MDDTKQNRLTELFKNEKYENIKKLSGVDLHKRIKLEFALRDNIKEIDKIIQFYDDNGLKIHNKDEYYLKELEIMFKKLTINNAEIDELIDILNKRKFKSVYEIYKNYTKRNYTESEKIKYYSLANNIEIIEQDYNITILQEESLGDSIITTISGMDSYTENGAPIYKNDIKDILKANSEKYYSQTNITTKCSKDSYIKANISINLALPKDILIQYITDISKKYKEGKISRNIFETKNIPTIFKSFKNVGIKYIQKAEFFAQLMFIYDVLENKEFKICNEYDIKK